jgi:hypothetical protein
VATWQLKSHSAQWMLVLVVTSAQIPCECSICWMSLETPLKVLAALVRANLVLGDPPGRTRTTPRRRRQTEAGWPRGGLGAALIRTLAANPSMLQRRSDLISTGAVEVLGCKGDWMPVLFFFLFFPCFRFCVKFTFRHRKVGAGRYCTFAMHRCSLGCPWLPPPRSLYSRYFEPPFRFRLLPVYCRHQPACVSVEVWLAAQAWPCLG